MKRIAIYIIMCMGSVLLASAQPSFRTAELGRLATALALEVQSLPDGYSHPLAKGLKLTVHKTAGTVDHIGRQLFTDEVHTHGKMPVLNFLERYFLQLKYPPQVKTASMMVRDDEFSFVKGSLATVDRLLPTDEFSCNRESHHYEATWSRNGKTLLSVVFPVEYELISGENKIEAESNLMRDIQRTQVDEGADHTRLLDDASYLSEHFSNRIYTKSDGSLILSSRMPFQTASNIMLSLRAAEDYMMNITQVSYGFKKKVFCVPLKQWIAFCRNNRCELYFGVEDISSEGDVSAVVLAVNEQENYNHVLTVHIPASTLQRQKGTIEARLYPYVPTHNVTNMYANYRKSNSKTIVSK